MAAANILFSRLVFRRCTMNNVTGPQLASLGIGRRSVKSWPKNGGQGSRLFVVHDHHFGPGALLDGVEQQGVAFNAAYVGPAGDEGVNGG